MMVSLPWQRNPDTWRDFARAGAGRRDSSAVFPAAGARFVLPLGMHPVFFGLKRAYYASLGQMRRTLRKMGLTSARLDLLYVVYRNGRFPMLQSRLWRTLGVCPSVVSRMLKRLEAMGYVRRAIAPGRVRMRNVTLTTKGRARVLRARRQFIGWGYAELVLRSVLEPNRWHSEWHSQFSIGQLREHLRRICIGFADRADFYIYPEGVCGKHPSRSAIVVPTVARPLR